MRTAAMLGATLGSCLLAATVPCAETPEAGATRHVSHATELLLAEHPTESQLRQGFLHLLDALPQLAPQAGWLEKAAEARGRVGRGLLLEPRTVALLNECYRETHGGQDFRMPPSVRTIADAREHIRLQLASVPGLVTAGDGAEAAGRLLEAAAAIVTPMKQ
jgi:hypothetical protein